MKFSCFIISLCFPVLLFAQTESRSGLSFEREVSSRSAIAFEVEHRALLEAFTNGRYLFLLASNRKISNGLSIAPAIRFETSDGGGPVELRLQADLNYKYPIGESKFTLTGRLRWQQEYELAKDAPGPEVAWRPRFGIETELAKKWTTFLEYEPRFRLDAQRREWSRLRYTLGVEHDLSERISFEVFYRIEDRIIRETFRREPQIGFYVSYQLPTKGKHDWEDRRPFGRDILN